MNSDISDNKTGNAEPCSRTLVLGLDGATWSLLDRLMESGKMPFLSGLCAGGAKCVLKSTIPPVTASAWSGFYTGRTPGQHGVFDFRRRMGPDSTKRAWVNHTSIKGPKIWELMSAQDRTVGLVNLPLTYPPVAVTGYIISGMPVPPTRDGIGLPDGIIKEVTDNTGEYISDIDLLRGKSPDVNDPETCFNFVNNVEKALVSRKNTVCYLIDKHPTDFTFCVFITPDRLSHLFWKILVPHPQSPPLKSWEVELQARMYEVFRVMDSALSEVAGRFDTGDMVTVMSDHGFGPLDEILKMNLLLKDLGYLSFRKEAEGGLRRKISRLIPEPVKRPIRQLIGSGSDNSSDRDGSKKEFDPYALIEWENTRAYSGGSVEQGIFLNVKGREPYGTVLMGAEYHRIRDEIIDALRRQKHPVNGDTLFDWVEPRENIYEGASIEFAPDIMYSLRGYRMVVGEDAEPPLVWDWSQPRAGFHRREGILVLKGPMIKPVSGVPEVEIHDVAPTILACNGLKIDSGMDGTVLEKLINPWFLEKYPPAVDQFEGKGGESVSPCDSDAEDMEDLLKGLGYLN